MRSEKGSITLYVLVAMLTLTAVLMAIYMRNSNARMTQLEITEKIKAIYENYNIDDVYATKTGDIPQILGYERGAKQITIKTLTDSGAYVDQNGKEIIAFAATTSNTVPTDHQWQSSNVIDITGNENGTFYLWIKNESNKVSESLICRPDIVLAGEYAEGSHKKYTDSEGNTAWIPAGFTVSKITGDNDETTISKGLVIYSGRITDWSNPDYIQQNYNQYVWIPVENPKEIYGTDANGNKLGKLYSFNTSTGVASALNWTENENGIMSWTSATNYREPDYLIDDTRGDEGTRNKNDDGNRIVTQIGLQREFDSMIQSINTYYGFYIGRYELTGNIDTPTVVKNVEPIGIGSGYYWYNLYSACKKIETGNNKICTSMIWGSQWDQAVKKSLLDKSDFLSNSDVYGWYTDSDYTSNGANGRRGVQVSGLKASAYNVFDMSGNVADYTFEAFTTEGRVIRGGIFYHDVRNVPASFRGYYFPGERLSSGGARAQLYLK